MGLQDAYDAMGNRLSKTDNGVTTTYTVDGLNRVMAATTGLEQVTYAYDANGNTASKTAGGVTRGYHYDRENRLVRVSEGEDDIFSAAYDYRCRRLEKTENGDTVSYLYDGGVSVQEYDAEGSLTTYLVRAGGYGGGIGDVVYKEKADGTGREYFLYNATGTTSALANDAGTVTSTSCYTAWGTETATVGTTDNVRKFSTKERSAVLGIDYFGFRYYDPELGRFLTRDPSGYPDGPNNYLYCLNSPVNQIDPLGLEAEDEEEKLRQEQEKRLAEQRERENALGRQHEQEAVETAAMELPGWGEMFKQTIGGMFDFKKNAQTSAAMITTPIKNEIEKTSDRFTTQIEGGSHPVVAGLQSANMAVGDVVGYTPMMEAYGGTDLRSGRDLNSYERQYRATEGFVSASIFLTTAIAEVKPCLSSKPTHFGPMNKGPLPAEYANTFRSGTYDLVKTTETTTLYRTTASNGNALGQFWTRNKPAGPLQATLDSAILPEWGNTSTMLHTLRVPPGVKFFEGIARSQKGGLGGELIGGGNQILFNKRSINPEWLMKSESLIK